jgi:hypothetical protein
MTRFRPITLFLSFTFIGVIALSVYKQLNETQQMLGAIFAPALTSQSSSSISPSSQEVSESFQSQDNRQVQGGSPESESKDLGLVRPDMDYDLGQMSLEQELELMEAVVASGDGRKLVELQRQIRERDQRIEPIDGAYADWSTVIEEVD